MSESKKYEFQYQHFNNSSNSQPFYGILDLSQGNSIISLKRLRKHNIANHVLKEYLKIFIFYLLPKGRISF